jgi:small subunit ribosomal protein S16
MGRKKQPHYRVVVADGAAPRDGRIVENLGYYKPRSTPARLVLDLERFDYWLKQGAEPSLTVQSLASKARRGGDGTVALGEVDLDAQRKQEADKLAARRTAERKAAEAAAAPAAEAAGEGEAAKKGKKKAKAAAAEPADGGAADAEAEGASGNE